MKWLTAFGAFLLATTALAGQNPRLHTATTTIEVTAGPTAPRVVTISGANASPWRNAVPETLPAAVEMQGRSVALSWRLDPRASVTTPTRVAFAYLCDRPKLRLLWEWQARAAFGPLEHTVSIQNLSGEDILLPVHDTLRLSLPPTASEALTHMYVEKGADTPSPQGTHRERISVGYHWNGYSSTYYHLGSDSHREIIPWSLIERADHTGLYLGVEFSGRVRLSVTRNSSTLLLTAGLNPEPAPSRIRIAADEIFTAPTVFLGMFRDGADGAGNDLRRWISAVLGNPATWQDPHYPLLVSNSWGSGMAVNEVQALRMIRDAADLGLEMYHVDAGWFRSVGDWHPNPAKFPHGLKAVADAAHAAGLRFGAWVDWAQAGLSHEPGALNARDPVVQDWLVTGLPADWKPEDFKGQTIDIGVPAARAYAERETQRIVKDYGLDMLEHDGYLVAQGCTRTDHPHTPPDPQHLTIEKDSGFLFALSTNSTDVSEKATRAYYDVQQKLREAHPGILLEICNDGGRMVDFGSAAHGDYFSITDTYDPLSNRRAFYDTSYVLPPAMLESYVEKWPTPRIENFRYMLRSGMMGWFTLMQDAANWTPEQRQVAKDEFALYKSELRPLVRDAALYHVAERPDGIHWDAIEYFDPTAGRGALYVFHGSDPAETKHLFRLHGVDPNKEYRLHFRDGSAPDAVLAGKEISGKGVELTLPLPNSSEIVTLREEP